MSRVTIFLLLAMLASGCGGEPVVNEPLRGMDGEILDTSDPDALKKSLEAAQAAEADAEAAVTEAAEADAVEATEEAGETETPDALAAVDDSTNVELL